MAKDAKAVNIRLARKRYAELATKSQKGEFLDRFCAATGMHRKSALRSLSLTKAEAPPGRRGRPVIAGPAAGGLLSRIWKLAGCPCSKLLKPMLPTWVDSLRDAGEVLDDVVVDELLGMGVRTIDRRLSAAHLSHGGVRGTRKRGRSAKPLPRCYGDPRETMAMAELARLQSLFDDLYRPTMKLLRKTRDGSGWRRVFEKEPKTPARRVLENSAAPAEAKEAMRMLLHGNDPLSLLHEIEAAEKRLRRIHARVAAEARAPGGRDRV